VTFGLGALVLSASMAALTYLTVRQILLSQHETAIVRQAVANATLANTSLLTPGTDMDGLLASLDTSGSSSVIERAGQWYSTPPSAGRNAIPPAVQRLVLADQPVTQVFVNLSGGPQLVVGIPMRAADGAYFEVASLDDLAHTLGVLALALSGAALVTTILGIVVGRWASGRAVRPLARVSLAAETIAGGALDTRLPATDDADLAPLAASFNRMADALQERIEREVRFASDVSHELRSPLTTLSASLAVLETHAEQLPARSRQALELLGAELRRFERMVDDLLEISRVDTGSADLSPEEVEVGELVRQAAATGGARGVPVEVSPAVADAHLRVDKRRIDRVLANLVANAAQYAGGATKLSAEPGPPGTVRLAVWDRGPGVAPDERELIFERFYRGRAARHRAATDGTGLGLSLVAEHVRLHGGRVWVEPAPEGGNRFVVELPRVGSPGGDGA